MISNNFISADLLVELLKSAEKHGHECGFFSPELMRKLMECLKAGDENLLNAFQKAMAAGMSPTGFVNQCYDALEKGYMGDLIDVVEVLKPKSKIRV